MILLLSCSKFEHQEVTTEIPSCELCAWADSLEGDYEGTYTLAFVNSMGYNDTIDSLHFSVQHIFLNKGPLDDSTRMFFLVTRSGGNFTSSGTSTWVVDDSLGTFQHTGFDKIVMNKDSITLYDGYSQPSFGGGVAVTTRKGVFYRQ